MAQQLQVIARRIADNRVIAGVHFPIDSTAGFALAEAMGDYFIARCTATAANPVKVAPVKLDASLLNATTDADPSTIFDGTSAWSSTQGTAAATRSAEIDVSPSDILGGLWTRAANELAAHGWA